MSDPIYNLPARPTLGYNELLIQLQSTPTEQIERLANYSEREMRWHQSYASMLRRVIRHRGKPAATEAAP